MPYQLMPRSWQLMHAKPVIAACLIVVPPNVVKFVGEWQLSHGAAPDGICFTGIAVGLILAKLKGAVPWHVEHPDVMPVWLITARP
jgi:hypothetical protein